MKPLLFNIHSISDNNNIYVILSHLIFIYINTVKLEYIRKIWSGPVKIGLPSQIRVCRMNTAEYNPCLEI